jgi:hemoglobin
VKKFLSAVALSLVAIGVPAQPAVTGSSVVPLSDDSLYRAFGGEPGLRALMDDFVNRLVIDPRIGSFFKNTNLNRLKEQLAAQLCAVSGGPCKYSGVDMKTAHGAMGVDKSNFNALVEVLQQSMDAKGIPFSTQNRMLAQLAPMHREIITK